MKQKSQNRFLAALLAVAMMLQMLPMLAFAEDATGTGETYKAWIGNKGYTSLVDAVKAAKKGETTTITLGADNYTLYGIPSDDTTKGKDLIFVGQGPEVTTWQIGAEVPDPSKYGTEYNSDYSLQGTGTVTFKNMTLCSADADYLGFSHTNNTVVENCVINGRTFYWGYQKVQSLSIRPSMLLQVDNICSGRIAPRPWNLITATLKQQREKQSMFTRMEQNRTLRFTLTAAPWIPDQCTIKLR